MVGELNTKKKLKNSREKKSFKLKRIIIIVKFSLGIIVGYIEDCVMRIFFGYDSSHRPPISGWMQK